MQIRPMVPTDFSAILRLNEESVHFLSPLTLEGLQQLYTWAWNPRVVEQDGEMLAFLLLLREGAPYASVNYRWFVERYDRFVYIDRIVVARAGQGRGLGAALYRDAIDVARSAAMGLIVCEVDADPPNIVSQRFHERFGFVQVGAQVVPSGKRVGMYALALGDAE